MFAAAVTWRFLLCRWNGLRLQRLLLFLFSHAIELALVVAASPKVLQAPETLREDGQDMHRAVHADQ